MAEVMYALKSEKVGPSCLEHGLMTRIMSALGIVSTNPTYGLYYIGKKPSSTIDPDIVIVINSVLVATEAPSPQKLGCKIRQEYNRIIQETGTENISFEKSGEFPETTIEDMIRYYEMTPKEREDVIRYMYIAKETGVR